MKRVSEPSEDENETGMKQPNGPSDDDRDTKIWTVEKPGDASRNDLVPGEVFSDTLVNRHNTAPGHSDLLTSARMEDWNEDDVCCFMRRVGIHSQAVESLVYSQKIDGDVLEDITMEELEKVFGDTLVFGQRKKILKKRHRECLVVVEAEHQSACRINHSVQDEANDIHDVTSNRADPAPSGMPEPQDLGRNVEPLSEILRPFDKDVDLLFKYKQGSVVSSAMNRPGDLIIPVHQFVKLDLTQKDGLFRLGKDTAKFVCACLNDRSNGTIHFGIHPGVDGTAPHGQIIGTALSKDEAAYTTFLERAMEECFFPDQRDLVRGCVRPPKFIEVLKEEGPSSFVVEVDVVPTSLLSGENAFYAKLPQRKEAGTLIYDVPNVYRFMEGTVKPIEGDELRHFMKMTTTLYQLRKEKEETKKKTPCFRRDLREKLVNLLCQGEEGFVGDMYPILVVNKPADHMNREYLDQNLSFLECVPWKVVFDFDSTAQVCRFMDEDREQVMKIIHSSSEFDTKSKANLHNPERLKNLQEDIRCSVQQPWVFTNGYEPLERESEEKMEPLQWKKTRREGFKEAVRFFGNEIPCGRAIVVFCLLSKDWEVMLEGAEEFLSTFPDQWMCIAEDDFTAKPWMEELLRRHCADKESLDARVVSGMPWRHIRDTVHDLRGMKPPGVCELVCSNGAICILKEKVKNDLVDLEILGSTECDTSQVLHGSKESITEHCKTMEKSFYRGHEVDWWNFWCQNHVCQRNQYQNLSQKVKQSMEGDLPEDDHVGRVFLYHQPGAGGTTLAKNVLWDLRKRYRCAIVRTLSDQTADQIMTFISYMDAGNPKPVLLLLDNEDEDKTNFLIADLEERSKRITRELEEPTKVLCVMLVCLRRSKLPTRFGHGCLLLKHELKPDELNWFHTKAKELDQNFNDQVGADPKLLISFNILKENFNRKYIDRTVKTLVAEMDNDNEKQLLKYVALLNAYDLQFRPVPTSAFDFMMFDMCFVSQKKKKTLTYGLTGGYNKTQRRWETKLSSPFRVLTNETTKTALGYIHSLRITSPLLSRGILDALRRMDGETLSDVGLSFLKNTDIFNVPTGMARRDLLRIMNDVLKRRRRHLSGRPESKFPPIIHDLMDSESVDKAKALLVKGYEVTQDPFVAQQITRVFMHTQSWDEAIHYAKLATDQKGDNSHLWDTYGRVFQCQLSDRYNKLIDEYATLSINEAMSLTTHALKGIQKFRKVQTLSEEEYKIDNNDAGYFGELEIVVSLLDCLSLLEVFKHDREKLHKFLVEEDFVPPELCVISEDTDWQNFLEEMKLLSQNVKRALNRLEDERMQLRAGVLDHYRKSHYNLSNDKLARLRANLTSYFGEDSNKVPAGLTPERECGYRQGRIFTLAGYTLKSIYDLRWEQNAERKLCSTRNLALQNIASGHGKADDYQTALCACFALILVSERYAYEVKHADMIMWSRKLYELRDRQDCVSLEPYMFYTMLNWPRKGIAPSQHVTPNILIDSLKRWKDAYYRKYPRQREDRKPYRKKDTTMFFLANGSEIHSIASYDELRGESRCPKGMRSDAFWGEPHVLRKLKRFRGLLLDDGCEVQVQLEYDERHRAPIQIPTSFPLRKRAWWNKTVYFVIGFSWFGPKAFDVKAKDPTEDVEFMTIGHRVVPSTPMEWVRGRSQAIQAQIHSPGVTTHDDFLQRLKEIDSRLGQIHSLKLDPRRKTREELDLLKQEQRLQKERKDLIFERQRSIVWWSDIS